MCGIIAITGKNTERLTDERVTSMLTTLSRRGPDDKGFDRFENTLIGQTRLSIVDIEHGHQPMRDNTHPYSIVFNGEIYGYKDLKKELEKKGHTFSTQSDTEVILKAYAEYGEECLKYIDGMFAFAIWDDRKKKLFIARDRFGKKPFYYTIVDETFIGASEIKAIFSTEIVKGKIDPKAIDDYLRLMYVPSHKSIYSNISMLPPAHAGIVKNGKIETWCYWDLVKKEINITYEDAKKKIKELFDESVRKRMVADVEIGGLLSGGIDSTIVTLYAQKYSSFPIKTFAVGYDGHKNELPYALEASKKIGTEHHTLAVNADLADELGQIIEYMDEPHGDSSDFPQHLISKLASTKVKVALTGDGADELFMGYGWYQKKWHMPRWRLDWRLLNPFQAQQKAITVFKTCERKALLKKFSEVMDEYEKNITSGLKDPIHKINAFDIKYYLPGQLLSKIDRTSMMHSLEVRSPFLDTNLVEFVYNLPTKFKMSKTENKIILKDILTEVFSKEFVYRRKQGFGAPVDLWLKNEKMKNLVDSLFIENNPAWKYIDRTNALRMQKRFYTGKRNSANKLWVIVCLLMWFEKHKQYHA